MDFTQKLIMGLISVFVVIALAMFGSIDTIKKEFLSTTREMRTVRDSEDKDLRAHIIRGDKELREDIILGNERSFRNNTNIDVLESQVQHSEWKINVIIENMKERDKKIEALRTRMRNIRDK